jgi:hypothetical protein
MTAGTMSRDCSNCPEMCLVIRSFDASPNKSFIKAPARHLECRTVSKIRVGGDTSLPYLRAGCFSPPIYFRSLTIVRAASTPL